jgi:hypothetical protein
MLATVTSHDGKQATVEIGGKSVPMSSGSGDVGAVHPAHAIAYEGWCSAGRPTGQTRYTLRAVPA